MPFFITFVAYIDDLETKSTPRLFVVDGEGTYRQSKTEDITFKILGFSPIYEPTNAEEAILGLKEKKDKVVLMSGKWSLFGETFQVSIRQKVFN